ncbi:MAG: NYN domain-containing protein [Acidobacteriota bacterium]|nr:NYN domain-containing protein [Acidobacteriota bacterium]
MTSVAVPPYGRTMLFIDGENLVFRYQQMLEAGYIPSNSVVHEQDVFVWNPPGPFLARQHIILRATYYTYATGSDEYIYSVKDTLKQLTHPKEGRSLLPNTLYPMVFKKARRDAKGKGVDIQMTVDILTHVYQDNLETVCLFSGDGDNKPVIETVVRNGKQIYVAAFSSGLNPSLPHLADSFTLLDKFYFIRDPNGNSME